MLNPQRNMALGLLTGSLALALATGASAADLDHSAAVNVGRSHVPDGVVWEVEDEIYDGVEDTYEVELIIDDGRVIADVEIDRRTGAVVQYDEVGQTANQRAQWQEMMDLLQNAQFDFRHAAKRVLARYPDAAIKSIQLDVEVGVLEYDVLLEDTHGTFQIEVDAVAGSLHGTVDRGITFGEAAQTARNAVSGTLIDVKIVASGGQKYFDARIAKRRARRIVTVRMDSMTGDIISQTTASPGRRERNRVRTMMSLAGDATVDFADALILTREEIGGGRPSFTKFDVRNGRLRYKSGFRIAGNRYTVWIDALTGEVWRRRG